jgi:hypothetical protein
MVRFSRCCVAAAALTVVLTSLAFLLADCRTEPSLARAEALGDPVAVISWIPPEVSNGTWSSLDASDSYDADGSIVNYTWRIEINNVTTSLWGQSERYKFKTLGLYKITLRVSDNNGSSDEAFTAVYSIIDVDMDDLPDWWEMDYFLFMEEIGSDDYDNDGFTNLEEYASGTDPTVQNAHPGLVQDLKDNWMYVVLVAAVILVAALLLERRQKRRRKEEERKKIDFAIEIERALHEE